MLQSLFFPSKSWKKKQIDFFLNCWSLQMLLCINKAVNCKLGRKSSWTVMRWRKTNVQTTDKMLKPGILKPYLPTVFPWYFNLRQLHWHLHWNVKLTGTQITGRIWYLSSVTNLNFNILFILRQSRSERLVLFFSDDNCLLSATYKCFSPPPHHDPLDTPVFIT